MAREVLKHGPRGPFWPFEKIMSSFQNGVTEYNGHTQLKVSQLVTLDRIRASTVVPTEKKV